MKSYIEYNENEKIEAQVFLKLNNVNERQAEILRFFHERPKEVLTVKDVQVRFGITATTAKSDIKGLLEADFVREIAFNKVKRGYIKSDRFNELISQIK